MEVHFQFFGIIGYLFLVPSTCCPETCGCTTSTQPSVDCSYRNLIHVPEDLPFNLKQLSLSVNYISHLNATSFANILKVTSLWLAHNSITTIQLSTFQNLTNLMSLDLSHNQLLDFPWRDLLALEDLELLNLNNNKLATVLPEAFKKSRSLRSLQLSNNRLSSLPEGIFDPLTTLSHLQLHGNAFHCSCSLSWLMDWMKKVKTIVDRKGDIICLTPSELKGVSLAKVPDLQCRKPLEIMGDDPELGNTLLLCKEVGVPYMMINEKNKKQESFGVAIHKFANGTIILSPDRQDLTYLCHVSNQSVENTGEISVSLNHHKISGWPNESGEKLLLFIVSERAGSLVNEAPCVVSLCMKHWCMLLLLLWYIIP
ncbi:PREDICTED: immunoglobulin superfamily containing leucine-rich repeat protein 2-like [Nanorana parkeri]|uniref:immunoglobulin superfamily containing leucine-rich repeat protein 2-like n=1 Tax=Nanorana parkeri TaxID=125878 RepID=UPI0008550549|nr:PREDICTED: immunoglobulin superfamily containing leucine-rich repeat protein 2-like [Nanorana parkeri]